MRVNSAPAPYQGNPTSVYLVRSLAIAFAIWIGGSVLVGAAMTGVTILSSTTSDTPQDRCLALVEIATTEPAVTIRETSSGVLTCPDGMSTDVIASDWENPGSSDTRQVRWPAQAAAPQIGQQVIVTLPDSAYTSGIPAGAIVDVDLEADPEQLATTQRWLWVMVILFGALLLLPGTVAVVYLLVRFIRRPKLGSSVTAAPADLPPPDWNDRAPARSAYDAPGDGELAPRSMGWGTPHTTPNPGAGPIDPLDAPPNPADRIGPPGAQ